VHTKLLEGEYFPSNRAMDLIKLPNTYDEVEYSQIFERSNFSISLKGTFDSENARKRGLKEKIIQ
jgi:hypothetical protein